MGKKTPRPGFPEVQLFLTQRLATLAGVNSMRAIREGLLWLVPCLLVSAAFLMLSALARLAGLPPWLVQALAGLHNAIGAILPLLVAGSIGYMFSIRYRLPRLPITFLCLAHVQIAALLLGEHPRAAATLVLFIAIASPLVTVPLMARLGRLRWTRIARGGFIAENVQEVMNLVIPGVIVALLLVGLLVGLQQILADLVAFELPGAIASPQTPYRSGLTLALLNSTLWFFGIQGYYAMQPFFQVLDQAVLANAADIAQGLAPRWALSGGLMGSFVFIGGAGATLSLALATLMFCKGRGMRMVALAALPISLLNVNEILLFGLPIILNLRLLLPFLLVPAMNLVLALAVVQAGWVAPASMVLPLTAPVVFNAYVSTGGDVGAVVLQLALVLLGTLVYAPYVRAIDRLRDGDGPIQLHALDTTFSRLPEEARMLAQDPLVHAHQAQALRETLFARIRQISEFQFHLEFQPQISLDGRCRGCEALLRARDAEGRLQQPGSFLRWLGEAGLMREVDLWVAGAAVRQCKAWRDEGFVLPISINVSGATLSSADHCERLLQVLASARGLVGVEITEEALVDDVATIRSVIERLHGIGAKVAIDDFGTGFSSMSYLHRFDVDVIKIDRSFVVALDSAKGELVMDGLLRFCEALQLGVVVEGVETERQYRMLRYQGELLVQGWYFSRALPGGQLPQFVRDLARH
ncbi:Cyclic di-GMP phosphodiesterase Gmr [Delftia tsuruhatensis]|uniref:EAL domain-containing protein n=1 Tax=Delftia tsuruhatensis TaxID=180282 RepID=UPI001E712C44|nr:EAL domain-containing protein [Delftia tsuruhatensis]CAB5705284.1 Cyclic di-GMP phosphodiesterase Gmr [Delftia tsuruhatensis]CAC9689447.1 Cyclic di-GMP phosphodiesterase Gmr [Delftia tsuruhatensis]